MLGSEGEKVHGLSKACKWESAVCVISAISCVCVVSAVDDGNFSPEVMCNSLCSVRVNMMKGWPLVAIRQKATNQIRNRRSFQHMTPHIHDRRIYFIICWKGCIANCLNSFPQYFSCGLYKVKKREETYFMLNRLFFKVGAWNKTFYLIDFYWWLQR